MIEVGVEVVWKSGLIGKVVEASNRYVFEIHPNEFSAKMTKQGPSRK